MKPSISLLPVLFLLLVSFTSCSQDKYDCAEILQQEPYTVRKHINFDKDSVDLDMDILAECGQMDSVDRAIFTGPMLGQIMVMYATDLGGDKKLTFQKILDAIELYKKDHTDDYAFLRKGTSARLSIQYLPVNLSEFDQVRPKLIETGMPATTIDKFETFLKSKNRNWSYKEAMDAFLAAENAQKTQTRNTPAQFNELPDLISALALSKKANKHCLIYFTGWTCVNSRKMEVQVLNDPEIKSIIENDLMSFSAYVDDRTPKSNGAKETIGQAHTKLEVDFFKKASQPYFVILSPDGKILATQEITYSVEAFKAFLEKGLK